MNADAPLAVAVAGAGGRMGRELVRAIAAEPERYRLTAAWVRGGSDVLGHDAGELAGVAAMGVVCTAAATDAGADVVLDFSAPAACIEVATAAQRLQAPLVCGTTGLSPDAEAMLTRTAATIPVLYAANFSLGVVVLAELAQLARRRLGTDFDVEILDMHHCGKRDAPSGTARMLGRTLGDEAEGIRTGPRRAGEIGYAVLRGGSAAGEHTVFFLGPHERLELTHRVADRAVFVAGALRAARWLAAQAPGRYTLRDCLNGS